MAQKDEKVFRGGPEPEPAPARAAAEAQKLKRKESKSGENELKKRKKHGTSNSLPQHEEHKGQEHKGQEHKKRKNSGTFESMSTKPKKPKKPPKEQPSQQPPKKPSKEQPNKNPPKQPPKEEPKEVVRRLSPEQLIGHLAQLDANVQCGTISSELQEALLSAQVERADELAAYRIKRLKEPKWSLQEVFDDTGKERELRLIQNTSPFASD